jgi:hypothetical protein
MPPAMAKQMKAHEKGESPAMKRMEKGRKGK